MESDYVRLSVIDVHGNFTLKQFPIDVTSLLPRSTRVSIPDANLEAAVREEIGNSITTHSMLNLTRLDIGNRRISDLTGLEHAHGLVELNLGSEYVEGEGWANSNVVTDFSPLEGLTQLVWLDLSNTPITDVSPLTGLVNLTTLNLSNTVVSDISPLAKLTQLGYLYLSNTLISDVSPLSGLTQLINLRLYNTPINDISPLSGLAQLIWLELANTAINDISPLSGLTQLVWLNLYDTAINDVSPLSELTELKSLYLSNTTINDVSPLSKLTQLTTLRLYNIAINDVSPLVDLNLTGTRGNSTGLSLERNPLSYASINTHIPTMQARGIEIQYDPRTPTTLAKRIGDTQHNQPGQSLATPLVVEVRDENGLPFAGVPVNFTVTAGGGKVRSAKVVSDTNGRAQTTLTLGPTDGPNTVRVTAADIQQPIIFSATATGNPPPIFRKPTTFSVDENTTAIGRVKAADTNQQDSVTGYSISPTAGEDSAKFSITPRGVLSFKIPPDYERPTTVSRTNEYIVLVSATGGTGKRERTGTQSIIITVTDVDEPPGVPPAPTVIPATPTSLIASWAAPSNTGPNITYELRYRRGNTGEFTTVNNGAKTSFTLTGLNRKQRYQVQVRAINDEGTSRWSPSGIATPKASPSVNFPDIRLRSKIAKTLGIKRNAPITVVDMLTLTHLDVPNVNIKNLTGLEHAHNLSSLNLGLEYIEGVGSINSNEVPDLSPLSGLTNLKWLYLSSCSISDVSPLSGLNQLTYLDLGSNNISDVSMLRSLTQLRSLYLRDNRISNVSPLAGLTQLSSLGLGNNNISDISALSGLNQLTYLNLGNNNISDVFSLSGLTQLRSLYLWNNRISNLSPLTGLAQLSSLGLENNSISDVSPLAKLTQLTSLYLASNSITDVSPLADLTQLTVLYLYNNDILDVSSLIGLNLTGTQWNSTGLNLERNPLSYASINTHIPAMQAEGIEIKFNNRTPTTLVKISGVAQQGIANRMLARPFVVEVRDEMNQPFADVPVSFTVTPGGGRLSTKSTLTDASGRAAVHLTLGRTAGIATVFVAATNISRPLEFTATAILLDSSVTIRDPNLRTKIVETLGKQRGGTLTAADMLKLTTLIANSANIRDLTGLQHASNLTTLSLENNNISEATSLAGLIHLESLTLDDNNISDMTPIQGLTQLTSLSLDNNNISDVTPLVEVRQLKMLSLQNNNISDVTPLTSLTQLKTLQLRGNPLSYLSLNSFIPNIQEDGTTVASDSRTPTTLVKVSGTHGVAGERLSVVVEVRDEHGLGFAGVPVTFRVTAGGGKLTHPTPITNNNGRAWVTLTLGSTPGKNTVHADAADVQQSLRFSITAVDANSLVSIRDVNLRAKIAETLDKPHNAQLTAADMLALRRLEAPNASIQNLAGLEQAHNLTSLNLGGEYISGQGWVNNNTISDFSPLFGLAQLTVLNLTFSSLTDVSFLSEMSQLTWLRLFNNDISDISPLAALTQLTYLELSSSPVSDISSLTGLTQLRRLYLYDAPISDLSPLSSLTQLVSLGISNTPISDMSALAGLTQLTSLSLTSAAISDISPLVGLTQLTNLNLSNNNISDISPLTDLTHLTSLYLPRNSITDVSSLSGLTQLTYLYLESNNISDVSPLVGLNLTGTQWDSTGLNLYRNPLSYASINTHIPAMQANGVEVLFYNRIPTTLVKISGTAQQGTVNALLPLPFVVEVRDQRNQAFAGVPVTFSVTAGGGTVSAKKTTTDAAGRSETRLTLGKTAGTATVRVIVAGTQPVQFNATAVSLSAPVAIRDAELRAAIMAALNKPRGANPSVEDMLKLTTLTANSANIRDLTGLQYASNLTTLSLEINNISNLTPLAGLTQLESLSLDGNNISALTPIDGLMQLTNLSLDNNRLSDVFPLTGLSELENLSLYNNNISDVAPLTALTQLNTLQLNRNPLSYPSLHTHIPAIQAKGTVVRVDPRTPTTFVKISGTHGVAGASLPVIVEVQDEQGLGFAGVPVTFTVTTGSGHLSSSNVITDATGRARTTYTLSATPGKNTVRATVVEIRQPTLFTITAVDASSPVTIRDTDLRTKITETLDKPRGAQLTAGDMLALTRLEAPNADIQNLTGLEHAYNLTRLNLGSEYISGTGWVNSNNVSDFSPLFDLAQLTNLDLSFNSLTDVSFLSNMPQLTRLELYNNEISDISVFSSLTRLTSLRLGSNVIRDASPLAGLTQLTDLDLSGASISDISSLSGLTQLRRLYLYGTLLSDVSALSGLTQLTSLGMSSPTLSDISPLAGLTQLTYLYIGWSVISDISALAGLTQLTTLTLSGNSITDVSPLAELTQLEVLHLNRNAIIDVSPLVELELPGTQWNSTGLYIERNPLNYASVNTHIPAMQARGVEIQFDNQAHSALVRVSGDAQEGAADTTLPTPFVVKAMDPHGAPIKDRHVNFYVEAEEHFHALRVKTDANGKAETTITLAPNPGVNRIRVTAQGITYPIYFTATATGAPQLTADVNGDGRVNIQDLVLVSSNFGQTGENNADVNGDGKVNIADLVLVAGAFSSGAAAAPAMHPAILAKLSRADIVRWLDEAKQLGKTDAVYLRGIAVLEQLLIALIPKETVLLANYPNPFNPETWIPYQLATPSEVTLHIYAVNGALVRVLALGHQAAGRYHSKSRAAYWDGRNEQGERVASGIYFYTLTTGNFTATRKMLIRK